jgi:hypothetical protein
MKKKHHNRLACVAFTFALVFLSASVTSAQWNSANAYGTSTGYGTVYGSYGLAATMQSMYNVARARSHTSASTNVGRPSTNNPPSTNPQPNAPPRVARNRGMFRPDATVDTGKVLADALGSTPDEKVLIKKIYASTKDSYETEAATRGWKNNIAGGLTFFTVAAMTVYHDSEEPSADAVASHYELVNASLDEVPDLAGISNKNKQGFNNVLVAFGGILLAGYSEGKQNDDAATLASYKKLAGMLIEMVLKTNPDNLRLENGQIVMK